MARPKQHPGYIERHGTGYRVSLCIRGRRHRFTVHAESKADAAEWAAAKHKELKTAGARRDQGYPAPLRMSELFDRFEREWMPGTAAATQNSYRDSLKVLRPWFVEELLVEELHDPTVDRVRAGHVAAFLTWRRAHRLRGKAPISARTLQRDRAVLHAVFAWADRLEMREGNPVERVPAPKVQPRNAVILTEPQYSALVTACTDPFVQLYVIVVAEGGLRNESEALWLRWEDVDFEAGFLHVGATHATKTGRDRHVPLSPRLATALKQHFARFRFAAYDGEPTPWLFHHVDSSARQRAGGRIGSLRRAVKLAATGAKLPPTFRLYDLRHRRATTLLAKGHNMALVQKLMGHANVRTTQLYAHLVREDLTQLVTEVPTPKAAEA